MDSRTALLNAPRRRRQVVALLAPALAAVVVIVLVVAALGSLRNRAARLDERRADLGRLEALLAAMPAASAAGATAASSDADFLAGGNDSLVQAAFQTRLREIADASGAEVIAVGNLPITVRADTRFAGLRASLSGTNEALIAAIFAIETSRPYLTIRTARIDTYPPGRNTGPQKLLLQVEFEGALRPGAAAETTAGTAIPAGDSVAAPSE